MSGASSDNDLPKTKKLRSEEEAPLLKDDTRERLIKNIVQSSGKNEVELTRNIEKIQNEIKVITDIAQTKRDELVTLIRLQKLKEEIIERLVIKVKEMDAMKTDNSKDWNLPEMFQINLSQPEHILSEKVLSCYLFYFSIVYLYLTSNWFFPVEYIGNHRQPWRFTGQVYGH